MTCKVILCLVILQVLVGISYEQKNPFFRKDYIFIEDAQSFYKIHTVHRTWQDAKKRCNMEGAQMFYAEDVAEADAVLAHWKKTQPFAWVYVGISDLLSKGDFETIDGKPVTDVYNKWGPGEPNDAGGIEDCVILRKDGSLNDDQCTKKYPFICKKTVASLEWNTFCDMPDITYIYNGDMGKCYKFHLDPSNWTEAYSTCSAEQSYLAIINSQQEHDFLKNLTAEAPKEKAPTRNYLSGVVYLGFHNKDLTGWKTIKGLPIADSGYYHWGGGQPDGGENERCGSMFFVGGLNDLGCHHKSFFICEHDIGLLNTDINERRIKKKMKGEPYEDERESRLISLTFQLGLSYLAGIYASAIALQRILW